ncbi:retinol dehydrogenase 16-like [Clavelina lepadiformis]|uniref:Uncharacterized protein n=1 Tax=Clavelina lepadiformis TaxID=159417 RepID=A0ABP0GHN4_CLALP
MAKAPQKTVVITGCDLPNSYGYELALCLDKQGYTVFAGCADCNSIGARSLASRGSTRLAVMQIDVTKQEQIDDATEMIQDLLGDEALWAVVNCAESYAVAEVDWCATEDFDRIMQINYLGPVRVVKSLLHLLRRSRGRVVNLSSISGCFSRAGQSAYAASKFALEAFSDSLRQEMLKWGVFVSLVQPAYFPEVESVLSDSETSLRLKRVPQTVKDVYGDDYFAHYIHSVGGGADSPKNRDEDPTLNPLLSESQCSTLTSGYSSLSSTSSSIKKVNQESLKSRSIRSDSSLQPSSKKVDLPSKGDSKQSPEISKRRSSSSLPTSASSTLKSKGPINLGNMNRVLHALMEAVTAPSPKVRYFVGSVQDKMLKSFSTLLPTVFMDTYFTSGEVSKVVPKLIKEKLE